MITESQIKVTPNAVICATEEIANSVRQLLSEGYHVQSSHNAWEGLQPFDVTSTWSVAKFGDWDEYRMKWRSQSIGDDAAQKLLADGWHPVELETWGVEGFANLVWRSEADAKGWRDATPEAAGRPVKKTGVTPSGGMWEK